MKPSNPVRACLAGATLALALAAPAALAADETTAPAPARPVKQLNAAQRAQELLHKAVAHYRDAKDKAFADFDHDRAYVDRELYVYVVSSVTGVLLASGGASAALINKDVTDLKDAAGKLFFREMFDKARKDGSGTVEYMWLDPDDNRLEPKTAFFQKVDDRIIAVGYYAR